MLQQMRAFSKSWISSLFLGALALSFVAWGIGDIFRIGGNDNSVVTVGSDAIPAQVFSRDYRNFLRMQSQQMKRQITNDEARKMGLGQIALDRIINRTALDHVVDELHLTVGDADVSANVRTMGAFNGPLGTFDRQTFERAMAQQGYGEDEFIAGIRGDMQREQLLEPISIGFQIPLGYVRALFAFSTETRAAEYVVLSPKSLAAIPPPTDAQLTAFVKAHEARFSTPEYRDVTYAEIGPEDVEAGLKVTDEQLHQAYDAAKATYVIPEKRDVEQITFRDEASAKAARAKIDGGMSFADVAKAQGVAVDNLGTVVQADLGDRGAAVFALRGQRRQRAAQEFFRLGADARHEDRAGKFEIVRRRERGHKERSAQTACPGQDRGRDQQRSPIRSAAVPACRKSPRRPECISDIFRPWTPRA